MYPQQQSLAKSSFSLVAVLGCALIAACVRSPEDIAPLHTSGDQYRDWSCEQIVTERKRVLSDLSAATAKQDDTRSDDVAGVILLALPVGSMTAEDQEPLIARLKGERDALGRIAVLKNCEKVGMLVDGVEVAIVSRRNLGARTTGKLKEKRA